MSAQQINLLEPSLKPRRQWLKGRDLLVAAALLLTAVLAHYQVERQALAAVLAAAADAAPLPADVLAADDHGEGDLQQRQARLQRDEWLLASVAALIDLPRDSAQRLQLLIAALPHNVWLKEVEFRGAAGVRVSGGALDAAGLAEYARRLGDDAAFKGLPLHVFAVDPPASGESGTARAAVPAHLGFVLSSLDSAAPPAPALPLLPAALPAALQPAAKGTP